MQPTASEFLPDSHVLPGILEAGSNARELRKSCEGPVSPPTRLSIQGMPNTGTNALTKLLNSRLDVKVVDGVPHVGWKHRMPFHPAFKEILTSTCRNKTQDWTGIIFTVRSPITWLLSQTTQGHDYGTRCFEYSRGGPVCFFASCPDAENHYRCYTATPPLRWRALTLLDFWAAYATYVPPDLPIITFVRYEDLLLDREAVVNNVAEHFKVGINQLDNNAPDLLENYTRHWEEIPSGTGLSSSQQRLHSFQQFWGQYGVAPFGGTKQQPVSSDAEMRCPAEDIGHQLVSAKAMRAYKSAADRGVMKEALDMHNYQVPTPKDAARALALCGQKQSPRER